MPPSKTLLRLEKAGTERSAFPGGSVLAGNGDLTAGETDDGMVSVSQTALLAIDSDTIAAQGIASWFCSRHTAPVTRITQRQPLLFSNL